MSTTRRDFVKTATAAGVGAAVASTLRMNEALGAQSSVSTPSVTGERVAASTSAPFRPYRSKTATSAEATTWVQIDLGSSRSFDAVKLYPVSKPGVVAGHGFPKRFRIEVSDVATFESKRLVADCTKAEFPNPGDQVVNVPAPAVSGRYVRLTATWLGGDRLNPVFAQLPKAERASFEPSAQVNYLSLSKLEVLSKGQDIALARPVSVDEAYGNPHDAGQLTRPPRPQGEGVVSDHPENVTAPDTWKPVAYEAEAPRGGIELNDGLFKTALQNNSRYLLNSYTVDELLRQFRHRAGRPGGSQPTPTVMSWFWEDSLAGSNAGRFLMGAGNTLRWIDDPKLRQRMNDVVDGIAECREDNGYIMGYPPETLFESERGAYTRSWLTHGLIEAGYAGNTKAFELLRGYYDWYNRMPELPQVLRRCCFGPQGTVANMRMYFTPVGKPQDLQVVQRYMQENYWLDDLIARKPEAIWHYPYDRPHSYIVTFLEPYLDLYRATGNRRYLEAARGGWELFLENWQNVGGSLSIIEGADCPPKSNALYRQLGETCGNAFWILLSQRFHLLAPEEERYVNEIEKSIYNVLLANQAGAEGIRYFSMLVGKKDSPRGYNTCCEGQGTRLLGSLPEFIYSVAPDGVYVNLFEPSAFNWEHAGRHLRLQIETAFPRNPDVRITMQAREPVPAKIRVRVPSWAAGPMGVAVNGKHVTAGTPGSYVTLERTWSGGDAISFTLPMALRMTKYTGIDQIQGRERYALEYGPLLMAALDAADGEVSLQNAESPDELLKQLVPVKGEPLHFKFPSLFSGDINWVPYFEVTTQSFSCFPIVEVAREWT